MADFWVLVSNSAGTVRYCELHSVPSWTSTNMLDKAGTFAFQIPAADPNSAQLAEKRIVTCYTTVNGLQTEVGSGIIDRITLSLDAESNPTGMLNVTGSSRLRELVYRHVGPLLIDNGAGAATLTGPQLIIALAPSGWTLDVVDGANVTTKAVYHQFQDESVLTSYVKLAEITGEHFRASTGKSIAWLNYDLWDASNKSGVRAFYNADPLSIEDNDLGVVISRISKTSDSYDYFIGRTYAFGVGDGVSRVTLNGSVNPGAWSADWVQGSDSKGYYLQHTPTWNTYGIESVIQWKDEATAQTLLETTYEYMRRSQNPVEQYNLDLVGLKTTLQPGTTIRVIAHEYVDTYHAINIDADLVIMTVNNRMDSDGLRTVSLTCSTIDKYTATEFTVLADQLAQADNYYTHTQPSGSVPGLATSITPGKTLTLAATDNYTVTFPATGTAALGAGTNTVSSTNNATIANHTHAITSSSAPGVAAALLATNASGQLQLAQLGVGKAPTIPLDVVGNVTIASAAGPTLKLSSTDGSVNNGDVLVNVDFEQNDLQAVTKKIAARIQIQSPVTIASDITPGDIVFLTGPNAALDPVEWLRIKSTGATNFMSTPFTSHVFGVNKTAADIFDGSVLGAELITAGDFSTAVGWTTVNCTLDVSTGKGVMTATGSNYGVRQSIVTVANRLYKLTVNWYGTLGSGITNASHRVLLGTSAGGTQIATHIFPFANNALDASYTVYFVAQSATTWVQLLTTTASTISVWDNVVAKEVTGGNVISRGVFSGGGTNGIKIDTLGGVIINDEGDAGGDLRAESDTEANFIFLDANGNTDGTLYLGGSTNGIQITKGGELTLIGTATRWNDLRVEPVVRNTGAKAPSFINWINGLYLYDFDDVAAGSEKEIFFQVQMPHDWKEQSTISPHVHWTNKTGSTAGQVVRWGLEYSVATIGGTFGASTTIYGTTVVGGADITVANEHFITELTDITMTNNLISTILVCRLFRNSSNAADTYTGTAGLLYVDFHYEIDSIGGSKDEFTK